MSGRALGTAVAVALLIAGCTQTRVTWRASETFEPLPEDAEIELYVRKYADAELVEAMLERGAEPVAAFPPGDRVAEFASVTATWTDFDVVLDDMREGARRMGADRAVATDTESILTGETRVLFPLVRSRPDEE